MSDIADPMRPTATVASETRVVSSSLGCVSKGHREASFARAIWVGFVNWSFTVLAMPCLLAAVLLLLLLNPRYNPGPLIFKQERVGRGGRSFMIYKFRTMSEAPADSTLCIDANASRITPFGAALRKFRIDELPNFVIVVLGDMNVIGPRPDAKEHAEIYVNTVHGYRGRFEIKPGITGFAQVVHGYAACKNSTRKKARYDRFYVLHRNARLDLFVIIRTLQVILTGFGSR